MLRHAGAEVWRVGFNAGDQAFWRDRASYIPYRGRPEDWPATLEALMTEKGITDLVLYGDTRPVHAAAVAAAKARGITVHVFEEGYLRPYWFTYERGGSNGHSRLMGTSVAEMQEALARADLDQAEAPTHWGDMRQHIFWGFAYHAWILLANRGYRNFRPHRAISVSAEFRLHLKRLLVMPWLALERRWLSRKIAWSGHPYHLVLLQLAHDASFRDHGPFATMEDFLATVIEGFSHGAPAHHRLVFKAHPLEDGRTPLRATVRRLAAAHGVADRVAYLPGGKLAALLGEARTAVTVNSTAGQQALWRGIPLKAFGRAVYSKPEFVSPQPIAEFFANPRRPDARAYRDFRRYLLETSQIPGGFYSARGRRAALRQVIDMLLAPQDPYDAFHSGNAAPRQQLQVVAGFRN
jgi:capsular polysaccharide export protein